MSSGEKSTFRTLLENSQLFATVAIAILGGVISWKQFELSSSQKEISTEQEQLRILLETEKQETSKRLAITKQSAEFLENARSSIVALGLGKEKTNRILMLLMKLEKDIRASPSGDIRGDSIKPYVDSLPFHYALLAGDSEALAHLGAETKDLELWLPIAKTSGDIGVRTAAIKALTNVALLTDDAEAVKLSIDAIVKLTQQWNVSALNAPAIDAMAKIAMRYRGNDPNHSEDVVRLVNEAMLELKGAVPEITASLDEDVEFNDSLRQQDRDRDIDKKEKIKDVDTEVLEYNAARVVELYQGSPAIGSSQDFPEQLIDDLSSEDMKKSRLTRVKIADYGKLAVPHLFEALLKSPNEYQTKIGVVSALTLMDSSVPLDEKGLDQLVNLLGDRDSTVRKATAKVLVRLSHLPSVSRAHGKISELYSNSENLENGNLIYNCAVVMGEWSISRVLTEEIQNNVLTSLKALRSRLEMDPNQSWSKTISKIDEYLQLASS